MSDQEEDEFQFETASLALRSNPDYLNLMSHLTSLCAYRIQVHKDIDQLRTAEHKALADPQQFVRDLQEGAISFPCRIEIPAIPVIDYSQYTDVASTSKSTSVPAPTSITEKPQAVIFWTDEEQKRLDELLIKFPPEVVESKRFAKIAKEMGNRTPKQIASRVQKYFKKLQKANLPIPGSSSSKTSRGKNRLQKKSLKLERPSTFFPERNISSDLMMTEDSDDVSDLFSPINSVISMIDKKEAALNLLKQIRIAKASSRSSDMIKNCSFCHEGTFKGASWVCSDCDIFYCPDCLTTQLLDKTFSHFDHKFVFS